MNNQEIYRGVAESRESVVDFKCDKWRGVTTEENGKESIIHLTGTVLSLFDNHGEQSLHSLFRGRTWHLIKRTRALLF